MGVNLSGRNIGMSQEGLDGADVGAVHEKVSRERVTESVRSNVFYDAGGARVFVDDALNRAGRYTTVVSGSVEVVHVLRIIQKESREVVVTNGEIFANAVGGGGRDENWAVLTSLSTDHKFAAVEVDIAAV